MLIRKCTNGYVEQIFDTKKRKFVGQYFIASDFCEYLTEDGKDIDSLDEYLPFDMVQPIDHSASVWNGQEVLPVCNTILAGCISKDLTDIVGENHPLLVI